LQEAQQRPLRMTLRLFYALKSYLMLVIYFVQISKHGYDLSDVWSCVFI
jgi:hypothetical protein